MVSATPLSKVVILGAGGTNIGHWIAKTLAADPTFTVTIVSRKSTKSEFPANTKVIYIEDAFPKADVVNAFRGQDAVISALGFGAKNVEPDFIDAAVEAGVKRFFPSEYGVNNLHPKARELSPVFNIKGGTIEYLKTKESTGLTWTAYPNGLWLDWALEPAISFAMINIKEHTAQYWDGGEHKFSWTTLPSAADGVKRVLLHPEETANKVVPVRNFEASQKDVVAALEKAQGVKYKISFLDTAGLIKESQQKWRESQDIPAALVLVRVGFMTKGYGSDLVGEGIVSIGNELLGVPELNFEDVIEEAVQKHSV